MTDNVAVTPGTGATVATDDIGGVQYQRVKATWGPDGTANDADTATGKPLPVQLRGSDGTDRSNLLPVSIASGGVASGAIASGAIASGALASGALASGAVASGAFASGSIADGAQVTLGAKADGKSSETGTNPVTVMSVLKQISASVQAPPSQAVTNAGTFAAQAAITAASGSIASGALASGALASGAVATGAFAAGSIGSGAIASGAIASGALASGSVASGAFAAGSISDGADVTIGTKSDDKSTATNTTAVSLMSVAKQISASAQLIATALGSTALDLGVGTAGSRTLRAAIDTSQLTALATTAQAMASGYQAVGLANDSPGLGAEDQASADGHSGMRMLAVRKATPANTSGGDGDYEFPQMSAGALWVATAGTDKTLLAERVINGGAEYETVAASQTAQVLGATGAAGDYIAGILVVPATTSPGNVLLLDNATSITVFTGGAASVSNLVPFYIPLGLISVSGAWKLTTGSNVSCIGIGNFL